MSAQQIDQLKLLLGMDGWSKVMKPLIQERQRVVRDLSFLMPRERPEPYRELDDHTATTLLKGENKALEWVLHAFENQVIVEDANRRREELASETNGQAVGG